MYVLCRVYWTPAIKLDLSKKRINNSNSIDKCVNKKVFIRRWKRVMPLWPRIPWQMCGIKELFIPRGDISISDKVLTYNYPGYVVKTRKQQWSWRSRMNTLRIPVHQLHPLHQHFIIDLCLTLPLNFFN